MVSRTGVGLPGPANQRAFRRHGLLKNKAGYGHRGPDHTPAFDPNVETPSGYPAGRLRGGQDSTEAKDVARGKSFSDRFFPSASLLPSSGSFQLAPSFPMPETPHGVARATLRASLHWLAAVESFQAVSFGTGGLASGILPRIVVLPFSLFSRSAGGGWEKRAGGMRANGAAGGSAHAGWRKRNKQAGGTPALPGGVAAESAAGNPPRPA